MAAAAHTGNQRPVDSVALAHIVARLRAASEVPWLHEEVARRMAQRLPYIRMQPRRIVNWGAGLGASTHLLRQAYPKSALSLIDADTTSARATRARPWWPPQRWWQRDEVRSPDAVTPASAELLWCNMGLHFEADIESLLQRWRRCLMVDGFLMFSTLGPGCFGALRRLYRELQWPPPMAPLVDMHDLGDMLVQAGFAAPVMDQEIITLSWTSAADMLSELRSFGGNAALLRHAGLRTPRWREQLVAALEAQRDAEGRLTLDVEIVYGHAFCPAPRVPVSAQTSVSLAQMRTLVRGGPRQ